MKHITFLTTVLLISLLLGGCAGLYPQQVEDEFGVSYVDEGAIKAEGIEYIIEEVEETAVVEELEVLDEDLTLLEEVTEEVVAENDKVMEVVEETAKEEETEAIIIIIEETKPVSLQPEAEDPDADTLTYTYTSPLDNVGKWATNYGDAGEYTITVTASDGMLTASQEVLLIVKKKEEAPTIDTFAPEVLTLTAKEHSEITFTVAASDLNSDALSFTWKLDGEAVASDETYTYAVSYDDAGSHTVKISVGDGVFEAEKLWAVEVENVNRVPVLDKIDDLTIKETGTVTIAVAASDPDADTLSFSIDDDRFSQEDNVFSWKTSYEDSGEYVVTVTASDGEDSVEQAVKVTVENVNRAPVIRNIVQG